MKKVLIVDDEYFFRQGFKKMIPWNEHGYEVYAEAKNGQEALEIIASSRPDLIFLDISMPIMGGIDLLRHISKNSLNIPVVLLTGYSEFDYAKQAITYGAVDYLLKPVETSDVCVVLERLSKNAEDKKGDLTKPDAVAIGIMRDKLFIDLVNGDFDKEKEELFEQISQVHFSSTGYYIVIFHIVKSDDWRPSDISLWKFGISNIIQELMESLSIRIFSVNETRVCGVLWDNSGCTYLNELKLKSKCEEIIKTIFDKLGIKVYAGIGCLCRKISQIRVSYAQAEDAVESKLLFTGSVILYSDVSLFSSKVSVFSVDEKRHMLSSLFLYDKDSIVKIINTVFDTIKETRASISIVRNVIAEFASILSEAQQHIRNTYGSLETMTDLKCEIERCDTIDEVCALTEHFLLKAAEKIAQSMPAMNTAQKTVEKAMEYIEREYNRMDLSADEIAKKMYVTRNYLCAIFKKVTGSTIGKYIDVVRVDKAKDLFAAGNTVIQYVSCKVGFNDPNYFGKFFKKQTGLTPSQYINTLK